MIKTFGTSWNGTGDGRRFGSVGRDIATRHRAGTVQVARFQHGIKRILVHDRRPRDVDQKRFTAATPADLPALGTRLCYPRGWVVAIDL